MTSFGVPRSLGRTLAGFTAVAVAGAMLFAQQPMPPNGMPGQPMPPNTVPAQPLSPDQLDTLVAPVALYPDPLLGQILAASTYPLEITEASQWLQQHRDLQGAQLMDAARQQNWDPSVQALVAFPDVLSRLTADISYTTELGNAFLQQQADVMAAVQRMRSRAMANGKLNSNAQETVTTQTDNGQQAINIEPANPDVLYEPYYNPEYVWGPPDYGYYPAWDDWGFGFGWGPGIYIGGFFPGLFWGGWGWGCNWFGGFLFNRPFFFSHYGFRGYYGGRGLGGGVAAWAHNPAHRLGVGYGSRGLNARYGAASMASRAVNSSHFTAPSAGTWNHFNGASNGFRSGSAYNGNAYRGNAASGFRSGGSYAGGSYARSYNYGGSRSYSAPRSYSYGGSRSYSYGGSRSYSYGGSRGYSAPRSSGGGYHASGGGSHFGGGGSHFGGGGGGFHGGGGGHGGGGHR